MLTVGQLAKACDVGADTVRYYERIGMIGEAHRTDSGYRKFDQKAAERIRFVKNAQGLGFSLDEIKKLLTLADDDSSDCSAIRDFAEEKIELLDRQIRQMRAFKRELKALAESCPEDGVTIDSCKILARLNSKLG